jgi:hypothetical protein
MLREVGAAERCDDIRIETATSQELIERPSISADGVEQLGKGAAHRPRTASVEMAE